MTTDTYNSLSNDYKAANPRPTKSAEKYIVRWCDVAGEMRELEVSSYALAKRTAEAKFGTFTAVR